MSSSSSSSGITTTTVNGTTRITGLSSGIDVDNIVDQLVTAEKAKKLNKLQQEEQTAEWTQEAYRDIITDIQDFCSEYFDVTSSNSIMKESNFLQYTATSSSSAVSVTSSSSASAGNHTVSVTQLATKATCSNGGASVSKDVQGSGKPDYDSLSGESFVISLDGTDYTVDLNDVNDIDSLQAAIDDAVGSGKITATANSSGYLVITAADEGVQKITVSATSSSNSGLTDLGFGDDAILSNRLDTAATLEKIADQLNTTTALEFNDYGQVQLTINGTAMTFDKSTTLATMMQEINDADLGVSLSYNSLNGEFVMTADDTGAGNSIVVADSGDSTFAAALLSDSTEGLDAKLTVDGKTLTRSSNSVTVDGVTYTLNDVTGTLTTSTSATVSTTGNTAGYASSNVSVSSGLTSGDYTITVTGTGGNYTIELSDGTNTYSASSTDGSASFATSSGTVTLAAPTVLSTGSTTFTVASTTSITDDSPSTISVTQDTDGVYDLISSFVEDYNTLIETINGKVDENADSDYPPLTDDQKEEMTDEEIENWETKAKVGLLESDSTLESFLSDIRNALIDSVSGQETTLATIGITSGTYDEKGTLYIDEDKLKSAIASDPEAIMKLFTQQATSKSSSGKSLAGTTTVRSLSSKDLSARYKEEGIAYRFYDIIQKNVSTIRDSAGNKGTLLEKAGTENDASDTDNTLSTLIEKYEEEIDEEEDRLDDYEEKLYSKYTTLETYISRLNSQLSSLSSYMSG